MNLSDILNSKYPSPTTLIASIGVSGSGSYTATSPVEITVTVFQGPGSATINAVSLAGSSVSGSMDIKLSLGAGQTVTYSTAGSLSMIVSAKRIN